MPDAPANTKTDLVPLAQRLAQAWDALRGRAFGPGVPLPVASEIPQPAAPRQFQFPIGVNTTIQPRGEYQQLTPFDQLRTLASAYDVAALCIATRIEELQGLKWAVVARDKKAQAAEHGVCDALAAYFARPDGQAEYSAWLSMLLYDLFAIDALTLYRRPNRGGGFYGLDVIDGATIKPLVDERGRTVAYQQIVYGRPEAEFSPAELIYRPRWTRSFTPYGLPPTELVILRVNTAIRKQALDLAYFTDGNVPAGFMAPPDGLLDPQQVQQFEEWFNADLQGNDRTRARVKFLPWKAQFQETRPFSYDTKIDDWMMRITCAAYGVTPQELGFTDGVNRANGENLENITYRRGIGPLSIWLKGLFDGIIQRDLGQPQLEWQWHFGESEDVTRLAQTDAAYLAAGVISPDEVRSLRFGHELDGPAPGPPAPAGAAPAAAQPGAAATPPTTAAIAGPLHAAIREHIGHMDGTIPTSPASQQRMMDAMVQADRALDGGDHGGALAPVGRGGAMAPPDWRGTGGMHKREATPTPPDRAPQEQAAQQAIARALAAQLARVRQTLTDAGPNGLTELWQAEPQTLTNALLPTFDDLATEAGREGLTRLPVSVDWNQVNGAVLDLAQQRAAQYAADTTAASKGQIAKLVSQWVESGGTLDDLLGRVARVYPDHRAEAEAITQVTAVYAQGNRAAWQASDVVSQWQFHTAVDDVVCPICAPLNGKVFDLADDSALPPRHYRCRCWVTPVVTDPTDR